MKTRLFAIIALLFCASHSYSESFYYDVPLIKPDGTETTVRMKFDKFDRYRCTVGSVYQDPVIDQSTVGMILIPSRAAGLEVTGIRNQSFKYCSGLTSINIPNSVTWIGADAFLGCSSLTSINIPNSVTSIGQSAFYWCYNLQKVIIDDIESWCKINFQSESSNPLFKGGHLYNNENKEITNVIIPEEIKIINNYAFCNYTALTSIDIPNSVTTIGDYAFYGCSGLTSITIPNSVTSIGDHAFYGCSGLTSITIPNSVTTIGDHAFYGCSGLTSITIPNSVTTIGDYAFYGCSGLTSITIPNSVTTIGDYAFAGCSGLNSIVIPNSVTSIGKQAFSSNYILEISVDKDNTTFNDGNGSNCIIETASNTLILGCQKTIIPSSVTKIGNSAFAGCTSLTSINIPDNVTVIGDDAFDNCTGLTSIDIPNSVTNIGDYAFTTDIFNLSCKVISCSRNSPPIIDGTLYNPESWARHSYIYTVVPSSALSNYESSEQWKKTSLNEIFWYKNTQTSITIYYNENFNLSDIYNDKISDIVVVCDGKTYNVDKLPFTLSGLNFATTYDIKLSALYNNNIVLSEEREINTSGIGLNVENIEKTNTSLRIKGSYNEGDAKKVVKSQGFEGFEGKNEIVLKDLSPGKGYEVTYYVITTDSRKFSKTVTFNTEPIYLSTSFVQAPSTCKLSGDYSVIDATVTEYGWEGYSEQNEVTLSGLEPNTKYTKTFYVVTKEGGKVTKNVTFTTSALEMQTLQPKVISAGNVIVAAETNVDDEETNVGFEWRRTDWTDDFASNTGAAYLYNGKMEGYIRNLYTEKLWKYRPYYLSNSGTYYYGDWVGLDPTNTSYFEPTVHTYDKTTVNGNGALVKGYALRGTDNIVVQGFKYWKSTASVKDREESPNKVASIPNNASTIEAPGQIMTAQINGLDYDTDYCFAAFITTSEGETFYGEIQTFHTDKDTTGINDLYADDTRTNIDKTVVGYYDLQGRKLDGIQKGVVIIRYSDGSSEKILIKTGR